MEPNIQQSSGMANGIPPVPQEPRKKIGPVIGIIAVVLLIIMLSLYFMGRKDTDMVDNDTSEINSQSEMTAEIQNGTASEEAMLEADLNAQLEDIDYSF